RETRYAGYRVPPLSAVTRTVSPRSGTATPPSSVGMLTVERTRPVVGSSSDSVPGSEQLPLTNQTAPRPVVIWRFSQGFVTAWYECTSSGRGVMRRTLLPLSTHRAPNPHASEAGAAATRT